MDEIGDFMSCPVLSIDSAATVQEAAQYMNGQQVGSLLVKEFDDFIGIVTEADLTRKVIGGGLDPETTIISSIMTQPILSMDRYMPVEEANQFMLKNKVRHLAVTEEEKIVGMISVKNLVAYFAQSFRMQE